MELLDFPLEIFQKIIHEFVLEAGVGGAWEYRAVCRIFSNEIYQNIFMKQHVDAVANATARRIIISTSENKAYFLYNRTKNLLGANESLPSRIKAMVEFLVQETGTTTESQREEYTKCLCKAAAFMLPSQMEVLLGELDNDLLCFYNWYEKVFNPEHTKPLCIEEKIFAAAAVNVPETFRTLLLQLTTKLSSYGSLDEPLEILAHFGHRKIVEQMIEWAKMPLSAEGAGTNLLLASRVTRPIFIALGRRDHSLLRALIVLSNIPSRECVDSSWLRVAARTLDSCNINIILDMKCKCTYKISWDTFEDICESGDPSIIAKLVNKKLIDIDKPFPVVKQKKKTCPLNIAVHCGNVDVVSALLDVGAPVDGPHPTTHEVFYPLHTAIQRGNVAIIKLLLERGARVHTDRKTMDKDTLELALRTRLQEIYELIRQAKTKQNGVKVPTYLEARRALKTASSQTKAWHDHK